MTPSPGEAFRLALANEKPLQIAVLCYDPFARRSISSCIS